MLKTQNTGLSFRSRVGGTPLTHAAVSMTSPSRPLCATVWNESLYGERFRLHNLSPQDGSRKKKTRKGRGHGAGQGGSCGFGMRGQKARSGSGTRPGFEGGQTPLYRRLPKLRGIAGGMPAGRQKFVTVNLGTLNKRFQEGDVVDLSSLKERNIVRASGKERNLPLKVLGEGNLGKKLEIQAAQFSAAAKEKIENTGGVATVVPQKPKWTQSLYDQRVAEGVLTPRKTKRYYYLQKKAAEESEATEAV